VVNIILVFMISFRAAMFSPVDFQPTQTPVASAVSHEQWNVLLKKHVTKDGWVNYKGFQADSSELNVYLKLLSANHPDAATWSANERKAFWINAYNAFTVQLVIRNYPCKSIKDLGGKIYKVNTPWDIRFIKIGDKTYDLNNIENSILRKEFDDPRIHFALNCASVSCPPLRNEAYMAENLDQQLEQQGKAFVNDGFRNKITTGKVQVSNIFKWYQGDFTKNRSLADFLNLYSNIKITKSMSIDYLDYDWNLNEKK
jgi:hypothetical protein